MGRATDTMETRIPKGRTLRIQDAEGVELEVVSGSLWVTYERDTDDIVINAGDRLRATRNGLTLAHAFEDVQLTIAYPAAAGAPSLTLGGGHREIGWSVFAAMVAQWAGGIGDRLATAVAQRAAQYEAGAATRWFA